MEGGADDRLLDLLPDLVPEATLEDAARHVALPESRKTDLGEELTIALFDFLADLGRRYGDPELSPAGADVLHGGLRGQLTSLR
jgi:hypothetical protein